MTSEKDIGPEDEELARKLGRALEGHEASQNPFPSELADLRDVLGHERSMPSAEASERMWSVVNEGITRPEAVIHELPRTRRFLPWAVAAALIPAAFLLFSLMSAESSAILAQAESEIRTHILPDGSVVTLRPHSILHAEVSEDSRVVVRLEGEAMFEVVGNAERTFEVQAGRSTVSVYGTTFVVSTWGEAPSVFLKEGSVIFSDDTGQSLELSPGEFAELGSQGLVRGASPDGSEFVDWMEGETKFESQEVSRVAAEIEHHFDVSLDIPGSLESEIITGRILLSAPDSVLNDLGLILGGVFVQTSSGTFEFEASR